MVNRSLPRQEGTSTLAIHRDIVAILGPEAVSYSFVTRYLRDAILSSSNAVPPLPEQERQLDDCDQAIPRAFAEQPFASIQQLSRLTQLLRTTVT
jgi:hypothetical protein